MLSSYWKTKQKIVNYFNYHMNKSLSNYSLSYVMYKASLVPVESPCWDKWANRIMWLCNLPLSRTEVFVSTLPSKLCSVTPIMAHLLKQNLQTLAQNINKIWQTIIDHCCHVKVSRPAQTSIMQSKWYRKDVWYPLIERLSWLVYWWRVERKLHIVE